MSSCEYVQREIIRISSLKIADLLALHVYKGLDKKILEGFSILSGSKVNRGSSAERSKGAEISQ